MASEPLTPIREYSLSVNNFNEPKVYTKAKAIMMLLTRLILLEPGQFQSHPDMGVGLTTRYRYRINDGSLEADLQARIKTQIDTYLPFLSGVQVAVTMKNKAFGINIIIDSTIFGILYDTESNAIATDYTTIAEL